MHVLRHRNWHPLRIVLLSSWIAACSGTLNDGSDAPKEQDGATLSDTGTEPGTDARTGVDAGIDAGDSGSIPRTDGGFPGGGSVSRIFVGGHSSCAFVGEALYCWGDNEYGQLGLGEGDHDSTQPTRAAGPTLVQFDLGRWTSCGLDADGAVWCSGQGGVGQTGPGSTTDARTPRHIEGLAPMRQAAVADRASCAVNDSDEVYCWGRNDHGILTSGTTPQGPMRIPALDGTAILALGEYHACAIRQDRRLYCWGENTRGRVGTGGDGLIAPTDVGLANIVQASLSEAHTCAMDAQGDVYCWGDDWAGQIGLGSTSADSCGGARCRRTPHRVELDGEATQVIAGDGFSCALLSNGTIDCWGRGVGEVDVALTNVTEIAAGGRSLHMCARIGEGTSDVRCWGQNDDGEIGDGTRTSRGIPTSVLLP